MDVKWLIFIGIVLIMILLDLGLFHRINKSHSLSGSVRLTIFYILAALLYGAGIWHHYGADSGADYLAAFFTEKSLAIDNIFVTSVVFNFFGVKSQNQHKVLVIGILSVIILRGLMIWCGAVLVERFEWVLYIFGVFLVITAGFYSRGGICLSDEKTRTAN